MQIQILSVQITTTPTARGSYQVADVAYKNLTYQGKVEGKKVMSFGATKDAFGTLATANPGDVYEVNVVKNDKGYNDWVSMSKGVANASTEQTAAPSKPNPTGHSSYETPEERAKKQVYIIKQSSITAAISILEKTGQPPTVDAVKEVAQDLTDWVLGNEVEEAAG